MDDPNEKTLHNAIDLANQIEAVIRGKETAAVYVAFGKIIGASASDAKQPDLCGLMALISEVAHNELARRLAH
jgi:hypothetical protein